MGRIRTVKPEFFINEELFDLEAECGLPIRVAYIGLWTQCDREGRFKWQPRTLKATILPHDDIDFSRVLHALTTRGFVQKYTVNGADFGCVPGFLQHQVVNNRERCSELPEPTDSKGLTREPRVNDASATREPRVPQGREGKGTSINGKQKRFKPPTVAEVREYCKERGNSVSPEKFVNHYETANWYRGKTKIKDWKACVRTWEGNNDTGSKPKVAAI